MRISPEKRPAAKSLGFPGLKWMHLINDSVFTVGISVISLPKCLKKSYLSAGAIASMP